MLSLCMMLSSVLVNFAQLDLYNWYPLTDSSKGGKSTIVLINEINKNSISLHGTIDPGTSATGYASFRIQKFDESAWDLTETNEIVIRLRGDGRTYKFIARDESALYSSVNYLYQKDFTTVAGEIQEIHILLSSMKPYLGVVQMPDDVQLNVARIMEFGFMATGKEKSDFNLEVYSMDATQSSHNPNASEVVSQWRPRKF